jgi:hypothetical protein
MASAARSGSSRSCTPWTVCGTSHASRRPCPWRQRASTCFQGRRPDLRVLEPCRVVEHVRLICTLMHQSPVLCIALTPPALPCLMSMSHVVNRVEWIRHDVSAALTIETLRLARMNNRFLNELLHSPLLIVALRSLRIASACNLVTRLYTFSCSSRFPSTPR